MRGCKQDESQCLLEPKSDALSLWPGSPLLAQASPGPVWEGTTRGVSPGGGGCRALPWKLVRHETPLLGRGNPHFILGGG